MIINSLVHCETKYSVIVADPPWRYNDKSKHRGGAERHYETMSAEQIAYLPIQNISLPDCALFIWTTWPQLPCALEVIKAWGFKYKTCAFDWVKRNKKSNSFFWGMGHWTRSNTEPCLLAVRGKPSRVDKGVHQVLYEPVSEHSSKPDEALYRIESLMGMKSTRIELFARRVMPGWDQWGDQVLIPNPPYRGKLLNL